MSILNGNILRVFESRYTGNPADTMMIAKGIADDYGMDTEEVADYIYIHRYEDEEELEDIDPLPEL